MSKILMKQSKPGSMDGVIISLYKAGQEYEIDDQEINQVLANAFVEARWAVFVRSRLIPAPSETSVIVEAPEIKTKEEIVTETIEDVEEKKSFSEPEAKDTRVYELAGELEKSWKEIVAMAKKFNIKANKAQSGLTDSEIKKIKEGFTK